MKKTILYIATAVALLSSCNKNEEPAAVSQDNLIRFSASVETRALINDNAALQASTFAIKDILGAETYIDDELTYDSNWKTAQDYPWKAGTHVFASWLKTDGTLAARDFFSAEPTLDEDNKIALSKVMTAETEQFDFLYSGVALTQTVADPVKYEEYTLNLPMHHLFSNVTFHVKNEMDYAVDLKSLTVTGVNNSKTAVITYAAPAEAETNPVSEGVATVDYTSAAAEGNFIEKIGEKTTTGEGDEAVTTTAPFSTVAKGATSDAFGGLIWEQTANELEAVKVNVVYSYEVPSAVEGEEATVVENSAEVALPAGTAWEKGKKYAYTLSVKGKLIEIKLQVIPWNDKTGTETYGEGAIATANALEYTSGAGNPDTDETKPRRQVNWFANPANPILAYFSAYSPVTTKEDNTVKIECIWRIKVTGDTLKIDVKAYNVAADGRTNGAAATKTKTTDGYTLSGPVGGSTGKLGRVNLEFSALQGAVEGNKVQLDFEVVMIDKTKNPAVETEINIDSEVTRGGLLTINYSE
mgnify:CR=1 FL=1